MLTPATCAPGDPPPHEPDRPADSRTLVPAVEVAVSSSVLRQTPEMPDEPGQAASRWTDLELETVFRYLMIGDLVACSQVNRLWRRVALRPRLQSRCLLQTYPAAHRQQMEQALDDDKVRSTIAPWCDSRMAGKAVSAAAIAPPCSQDLLCTAVLRLLRSRFFYPASMCGFFQVGTDIQQLVCSPDGRYFAIASHTAEDQKGIVVELCHHGPGGLPGMVVQCPRTMLVYQLAFSADSRSLWILYKTGYEEIWQVSSGGVWSRPESPPTRLFPGCVHKAVFSRDGYYLAVLGRNRLRIYCQPDQEGAPRISQWGLAWQDSEEYFMPVDPALLPMQWSDDSQHFILASERSAWLATRTGSRWRCQTLSFDAPVRGQPVFGVDSRLLALATSPRSEKGQPVVARIGLWRFEPGQGWQAIREIHPDGPPCLWAMAHPRTGYRIPVAFSPDAQWVVMPASDNLQDLYILPVRGRGAWALSTRLPCGQQRVSQGVCDFVQSVAWSSNSQHLAVVTALGVYIWQRSSGRQWRERLHLDNPEPPTPVRLVWSPDGYHCALAMGRLAEVSLWGPAADGSWSRKLYFPRGVLGVLSDSLEYKRGVYGPTHKDAPGQRIDALLFMPDATRFLILSFGQLNTLVAREADLDFYTRLHSLHLVPELTESPVPVPGRS